MLSNPFIFFFFLFFFVLCFSFSLFLFYFFLCFQISYPVSRIIYRTLSSLNLPHSFLCCSKYCRISLLPPDGFVPRCRPVLRPRMWRWGGAGCVTSRRALGTQTGSSRRDDRVGGKHKLANQSLHVAQLCLAFRPMICGLPRPSPLVAKAARRCPRLGDGVLEVPAAECRSPTSKPCGHVGRYKKGGEEGGKGV